MRKCLHCFPPGPIQTLTVESQKLEISDFTRKGIVLSMQQKLEIGCKQGFQYTPRKIIWRWPNTSYVKHAENLSKISFSIIILHVHPQYASHIYKILKEYIKSLRLISLYALWSLLFIMRNGKKLAKLNKSCKFVKN